LVRTTAGIRVLNSLLWSQIHQDATRACVDHIQIVRTIRGNAVRRAERVCRWTGQAGRVIELAGLTEDLVSSRVTRGVELQNPIVRQVADIYVAHAIDRHALR